MKWILSHSAFRIPHSALAVLAGLALCVPSYAAQKTIRSIDQRFASADVEEVPSFRRHVLPLMGRLGCNGRACHGSFQGQGGFRLSLFGYDFDADMTAITKGEHPRVDLEHPKESLIIKKPTMQIDHDGDERYKVDTWQYRVFLKWIENGCQGLAKDEADFDHLEVTPKEIVFKKPGEKAQLKVIAHWSDGTQEDVTTICRFRTNDDATASINETGEVTMLGKGDTHVVAFYDNGVVPVQVILPVSDLVNKKYPKVPTPTKIDELVVEKLKKLGTVPSELSSDDEFLRRVSLDLAGTPPTPEEIKAFLADTRGDKRARKIEELLNSAGYAAWWATKLCDYMNLNDSNLGENSFRAEQAKQWYAWVERRVRENKPYDDLIAGVVLATGRKDGQSFEDYCEEMSSYFRKKDPADFSERETMPHYWTRRMNNQAKDRALSFAYSFLGTRIQCAECHKHPFDQWTKQDFDQFTAFFGGIVYNTRNEDKKEYQKMMDALDLDPKVTNNNQKQKLMADIVKDGKVVPWREVYVNVSANAKSKGADNKDKQAKGSSRVVTPKLLGGDEVSVNGDPRQALMDWMRAKDNPYFAKAFVNRVWASYFNVGIIEPPDDMNLANPPSNEALLAYLTDGFVEHRYDMKWLHREIVNSRTYQLSWQTNQTNKYDLRNFSHAVVRRLPAEVAYDAVKHATASHSAMLAMHSDMGDRYIGVRANYNFARGGTQQGGDGYALALFGKSIRTSNCDCDRSNEPSLLQTVFLQNDSELFGLLDRKDGWLSQIDYSRRAKDLERAESDLQKARKSKDEDKIAAAEERVADLKAAPQQQSPPELVTEAYLRTVGRLPNDRELAKATQYLSEASDTVSGMKDLLWALLNTKEFIVNR